MIPSPKCILNESLTSSGVGYGINPYPMTQEAEFFRLFKCILVGSCGRWSKRALDCRNSPPFYANLHPTRCILPQNLIISSHSTLWSSDIHHLEDLRTAVTFHPRRARFSKSIGSTLNPSASQMVFLGLMFFIGSTSDCRFDSFLVSPSSRTSCLHKPGCPSIPPNSAMVLPRLGHDSLRKLLCFGFASTRHRLMLFPHS